MAEKIEEEGFEISGIKKIKQLYAVTVNYMTLIVGSYSDSTLPLPEDLVFFFRPYGIYQLEDLKTEICKAFRKRVES